MAIKAKPVSPHRAAQAARGLFSLVDTTDIHDGGVHRSAAKNYFYYEGVKQRAIRERDDVQSQSSSSSSSSSPSSSYAYHNAAPAADPPSPSVASLTGQVQPGSKHRAQRSSQRRGSRRRSSGSELVEHFKQRPANSQMRGRRNSTATPTSGATNAKNATPLRRPSITGPMITEEDLAAARERTRRMLYPEERVTTAAEAAAMRRLSLRGNGATPGESGNNEYTTDSTNKVLARPVGVQETPLAQYLRGREQSLSAGGATTGTRVGDEQGLWANVRKVDAHSLHGNLHHDHHHHNDNDNNDRNEANYIQHQSNTDHSSSSSSSSNTTVSSAPMLDGTIVQKCTVDHSFCPRQTDSVESAMHYVKQDSPSCSYDAARENSIGSVTGMVTVSDALASNADPDFDMFGRPRFDRTAPVSSHATNDRGRSCAGCSNEGENKDYRCNDPDIINNNEDALCHEIGSAKADFDHLMQLLKRDVEAEHANASCSATENGRHDNSHNSSSEANHLHNKKAVLTRRHCDVSLDVSCQSTPMTQDNTVRESLPTYRAPARTFTDLQEDALQELYERWIRGEPVLHEQDESLPPPPPPCRRDSRVFNAADYTAAAFTMALEKVQQRVAAERQSSRDKKRSSATRYKAATAQPSSTQRRRSDNNNNDNHTPSPHMALGERGVSAGPGTTTSGSAEMMTGSGLGSLLEVAAAETVARNALAGQRVVDGDSNETTSAAPHTALPQYRDNAGRIAAEAQAALQRFFRALRWVERTIRTPAFVCALGRFMNEHHRHFFAQATRFVQQQQQRAAQTWPSAPDDEVELRATASAVMPDGRSGSCACDDEPDRTCSKRDAPGVSNNADDSTDSSSIGNSKAENEEQEEEEEEERYDGEHSHAEYAVYVEFGSRVSDVLLHVLYTQVPDFDEEEFALALFSSPDNTFSATYAGTSSFPASLAQDTSNHATAAPTRASTDNHTRSDKGNYDAYNLANAPHNVLSYPAWRIMLAMSSFDNFCAWMIDYVVAEYHLGGAIDDIGEGAMAVGAGSRGVRALVASIYVTRAPDTAPNTSSSPPATSMNLAFAKLAPPTTERRRESIVITSDTSIALNVDMEEESVNINNPTRSSNVVHDTAHSHSPIQPAHDPIHVQETFLVGEPGNTAAAEKEAIVESEDAMHLGDVMRVQDAESTGCVEKDSKMFDHNSNSSNCGSMRASSNTSIPTSSTSVPTVHLSTSSAASSMLSTSHKRTLGSLQPDDFFPQFPASSCSSSALSWAGATREGVGSQRGRAALHVAPIRRGGAGGMTSTRNVAVHRLPPLSMTQPANSKNIHAPMTTTTTTTTLSDTSVDVQGRGMASSPAARVTTVRHVHTRRMGVTASIAEGTNTNSSSTTPKANSNRISNSNVPKRASAPPSVSRFAATAAQKDAKRQRRVARP